LLVHFSWIDVVHENLQPAVSKLYRSIRFICYL